MSMQAQSGLSRMAVLSSSLMLAAGFVMFRSLGCQSGSGQGATGLSAPAVERMSGSKSEIVFVPPAAEVPSSQVPSSDRASMLSFKSTQTVPQRIEPNAGFSRAQAVVMTSSKSGSIASYFDVQRVFDYKPRLRQTVPLSSKWGGIVESSDVSEYFDSWIIPWWAAGQEEPRLRFVAPPTSMAPAESEK